MIVTTYTYSENAKTQRMIDSFTRFGYEVANFRAAHSGTGACNTALYEGHKRAVTGHDTFLYADAGDSICQRKFKVPDDKIIFAAEKNLWPDDRIKKDYPKHKSEWKYLNGGGWAGNLHLMIEFWDKYRSKFNSEKMNGQHQLHLAFLAALKDGFPVELDYECKIFQCIAHEGINPEFSRTGKKVKNLVTKKIPAVIHGNGTSNMDWVEEMVL